MAASMVLRVVAWKAAMKVLWMVVVMIVWMARKKDLFVVVEKVEMMVA